MSRRILFSIMRLKRLSHACGNESLWTADDVRPFLFIPRMWEWVDKRDANIPANLVYPVRVGMSRNQRGGFRAHRRLSHASGNESVTSVDTYKGARFIPRRWEWVDKDLHIEGAYPVYPTRVGMSRTMLLLRCFLIQLSHIRGNESFLPDQSIIPSFRTWQLEMQRLWPLQHVFVFRVVFLSGILKPKISVRLF